MSNGQLSILITGGAGFVGSSLALQIKSKYPKYSVVVFDNLKRRGSELNLSRLNGADIKFIHGDIRNQEDFLPIPNDIDIVIEASAEPSVMAGIDGSPDYMINTNLLGTINCLNFARLNNANFIFLSTSRVYPIKIIESVRFNETATRFELDEIQDIPGVSNNGISEKLQLTGFRSLYGSTKLCSELFIQEYAEYYGLKAIVNRCGVITGPWQMGKVDQGFVVLWVARHFWKKRLSYIGYGGSGKQVRDILHVNDLFDLIDYEIHNINNLQGELFNVGGGKEISISLLELTDLCKKITGNTISIDKVRENRKGDVRIYLSDTTRVTKVTGWKPKIGTEDIIRDIYKWLSDYQSSLETVLN